MNQRRPEKWEAYSFIQIATYLEANIKEAADFPDSPEGLEQAKYWAELFQTKFEKMTL